MRFVLVSTHIDQTTGYSKVSNALLRQLSSLAPKVKTFHFGFQRHPNRPSTRKAPDGVILYDAAANEDPREEGFGFNKFHEYLETVNPDVVMIYNDPLIISKFIDSAKHEKGKAPYKLWCYVDQVYAGIAPPLMKILTDHADRIFCFTEHWRLSFLEQYGAVENLHVLEHAVDPSIFIRMNKGDRLALRKKHGIAEEAILLFNANRNSQRKRLDLTIAGFVRLLKEQPDLPVHLLLATNLNPQAGAFYDCMRIFTEECKRCGLKVEEQRARFMVVDTAPPNALSDTDINNLYNMCDLGVNTSDGEGFGLCQLEHLYTGAPQIVTDVGSYRSFLKEGEEAQFIAPSEDRAYMAGTMPLGFYTPHFSSTAVYEAMAKAVKELDGMRAAVKKHKFSSWSTVCDPWLELIMAERA